MDLRELEFAGVDSYDGGSTTPLRRSWVLATVREVQVCAASSLRPDADPFAVLAMLASRVDRPRGPVEQLVAAQLLDRAARDLFQARVAAGALTFTEMAVHVFAVADLCRRVDWNILSDKLRAKAADPQTCAHRVRVYIDQHSHESIHLGVLARATGASVRTITEVFRREYGLTIHEYLVRCRVRRALHLLSRSEEKVSAIASNVGLLSKASMYRHVHRLTGRRPGAFRHDPELAAEWITHLTTQAREHR